MPLYDYDCAACGRRFEAIHGVHADPPASCPLCGSGPVRKAFAAPAIHFKGSGWAKKERRSAARSTEPAKDGAEAGTASGASAGEGGAAATTNGTSADPSTTTSKPSGASKTSPPSGAD